ncbi:heme-binding protein 2-like [Solea solea]|uniref:heme-binding protein 2-like n=1 Tax=Solea solea TaxID=90069 RepID=UPI00272DBD35|nr:heme-binding protein 2-like [Solea solea]
MEQPLFVFFFFFLVLVSSCWSWNVPEFCLGKQCPVFKTVNSQPLFEERQYEATDWISTRAEARSREAFLRARSTLDSYCTEHANVKVATDTWPVLAIATGEEDSGEQFLCWFIDPDQTIPENTPPQIPVRHVPTSTVYVRTFNGLPSLENFEKNAAELRKALRNAGRAFDEQTYGVAAYGFLTNLKQEIWIWAV